MSKNIEGLIESGKKRTKEAEEKVYKALNVMRRDGDKITVAGVARVAGVTANFIYKHPELLEAVQKYASSTKRKTVQTQDSKDVVISCLKEENKKLKQRITMLEKNEDYKKKYNEAEKEIARLKKELTINLSSRFDINY